VRFILPTELALLEDAQLVRMELQLVGHEVDVMAVEQWTLAERVVVHDYCMRARLFAEAVGKKKKPPLELREPPSFLIAADVWKSQHSFWQQLTRGEQRVAS
jgi:hypothetical protein